MLFSDNGFISFKCAWVFVLNVFVYLVSNLLFKVSHYLYVHHLDRGGLSIFSRLFTCQSSKKIDYFFLLFYYYAHECTPPLDASILGIELMRSFSFVLNLMETTKLGMDNQFRLALNNFFSIHSIVYIWTCS